MTADDRAAIRAMMVNLVETANLALRQLDLLTEKDERIADRLDKANSTVCSLIRGDLRSLDAFRSPGLADHQFAAQDQRKSILQQIDERTVAIQAQLDKLFRGDDEGTAGVPAAK